MIIASVSPSHSTYMTTAGDSFAGAELGYLDANLGIGWSPEIYTQLAKRSGAAAQRQNASEGVAAT